MKRSLRSGIYNRTGEMEMNEERQMILKMLQEGKISVEEADALMQVTVDRDTTDEAGEPEGAEPEAGGGETEPEAEEGEAEPKAEGEEAEHTGADTSDRGSDRDENSSDEGFAAFEGFEGFGRNVAGRIGEALRNSIGEVLDSVSSSVREAQKSAFADVKSASESIRQAFDRPTVRGEAHRAFDTSGADTMRLKNRWGDISIVACEGEEIEVSVDLLVAAPDEARAAEIAESIVPRFTVNNGSIDIDLENDPRDHEPAVRIRANWSIRCPARLAVAVACAGGDLTVSGMRGPNTQLASGSGDITADDLQSGVSLSTGSGSIDARDIEGELSVKSGSGSVRVVRVNGSINIRTGSGDVDLGNLCCHALTLKTGSGDARCELSEADRARIDCLTGSGDLELLLGESVGGQLEVRTGSGTVGCEIAADVREQSKRSWSARIPGGDSHFRIVTGSGDVSIHRV